jgi:hypothetical protein
MPWTIFQILDVICVESFEIQPPVPNFTKNCIIPWLSSLGVIIVNQDVVLIRVSDGQEIKILGASVDGDMDSFVWRFSAQPASRAMVNYLRPAGAPVEVQLVVNQYLWRFLVESISEEYQHGDSVYKIQGRSPSCVLARPYSALITKLYDSGGYPIGIDAQQIVTGELGGTGWSQDWDIIDWHVPPDIYSVQDADKMSIIADVAKAAGGFIMTKGGFTPSEPYDKQLHFQYRYKVSPKNIALATPDAYILPGEFFTQSLEWNPQPKYDHLYVAGQKAGVLVHVKRLNAPFTNPAASEIHPLILTEAVAQQRGREILDSKGYDQTIYRMTMPLPLASLGHRPTLLKPGYIVEVQDYFETWRGFVKAVSLTIERPGVTMSADIERHYTA